jgi:hypothetical protein
MLIVARVAPREFRTDTAPRKHTFRTPFLPESRSSESIHPAEDREGHGKVSIRS